MTSNREPNDDDVFIRDLISAHDVEVPALTFRHPVHRTASGGFLSRHWRTSAVAAALAGVALFLGASAALPGSEPSSVSAEEILQKASVVASAQSSSGQQPYHLVAETTVTGDKGVPLPVDFNSKYTRETWYAGPEQYRTEQRSGAASQAVVVEFSQARNGDVVWLSNRTQAGLKVVHGSASVLDFKFSNEALPGSASLADILETYNQPCMKAIVEGETSLLGRDAYVIRVDFEPKSCAKAMGKDAPKGAGRNDTHRMTIDKELFLPLATERIDEDGNVPYRYAVTQLDLAPSFSPDVFTFQPPPGARVTEVASMIEAKLALSDELPVDKVSKDGCTVKLEPVSKDSDQPAKIENCPANSP